MDKNPLANVGDTSSSLLYTTQGSPYVVKQLSLFHHNPLKPELYSPGAITTEARVPQSPCFAREATIMRSPHTAMKSSPSSWQVVAKPSAMKTHCGQKYINKSKLKMYRGGERGAIRDCLGFACMREGEPVRLYKPRRGSCSTSCTSLPPLPFALLFTLSPMDSCLLYSFLPSLPPHY